MHYFGFDIMRNFYLSFLLILFLGNTLHSCKKEVELPENNTNTQLDENKVASITPKDISNLKYTEYALSNAAENATKDWLKFQELYTQIESLKKGNISFFTDEKDVIQAFLTDLQNEVPPILDENSIKVRLVSLSTAIYKLEGSFRFDSSDKEVLLENIKDLLIAHTNLIFQINKKLEKDSQNIIKPV